MAIFSRCNSPSRNTAVLAVRAHYRLVVKVRCFRSALVARANASLRDRLASIARAPPESDATQWARERLMLAAGFWRPAPNGDGRN